MNTNKILHTKDHIIAYLPQKDIHRFSVIIERAPQNRKCWTKCSAVTGHLWCRVGIRRLFLDQLRLDRVAILASSRYSWISYESAESRHLQCRDTAGSATTRPSRGLANRPDHIFLRHSQLAPCSQVSRTTNHFSYAAGYI